MLEKINHKTAPKEVVNALVTLYHQGKFLLILEKEKQLVSLYQDSIDILNIFGSANIALQNYKKAITNFNKAIRINPEVIPPPINKAFFFCFNVISLLKMNCCIVQIPNLLDVLLHQHHFHVSIWSSIVNLQVHWDNILVGKLYVHTWKIILLLYYKCFK